MSDDSVVTAHGQTGSLCPPNQRTSGNRKAVNRVGISLIKLFIMKNSRLLIITAFLLAVTSAFAFQATSGQAKAITLSTASVFYGTPPSNCNLTTSCSNDNTQPACVSGKTMYDHNNCTTVSQFQFLPAQ